MGVSMGLIDWCWSLRYSWVIWDLWKENSKKKKKYTQSVLISVSFYVGGKSLHTLSIKHTMKFSVVRFTRFSQVTKMVCCVVAQVKHIGKNQHYICLKVCTPLLWMQCTYYLITFSSEQLLDLLHSSSQYQFISVLTRLNVIPRDSKPTVLFCFLFL